MDPHGDDDGEDDSDYDLVSQPEIAGNDDSDGYTFVENSTQDDDYALSVLSWDDDDDEWPIVSDDAAEVTGNGTGLLSNSLKSWLLFGNVKEEGSSSGGGVVEGLSSGLSKENLEKIHDDEMSCDHVSRGDLAAAEACRYCGLQGLNYLARCNVEGCWKWFCNTDVNNHGSHITHHLIRARHREVCVHNDTLTDETILECYNCGCRDVHQLGFVLNTAARKAVLLCREPSPCIKALNDLNWEPSQWCHLMGDKGFPGWLVKIPSEREQLRASKVGAQQIYKLEELWKENPGATLEDLEKLDVDKGSQFVALTYPNANHMSITFKQDHGCTPEKLPNNQKQRIVLSQKPEKVYNDRDVCFTGGPGSAPSDNLDIVATSNRNTDKRGNHARGSDTPPDSPNYMSRPEVPAHGCIASPQPYTILTRTDARGLLEVAPQVPLQSHGSRGALTTPGTASGRHLRQQRGSKQTKEVVGSTFRFSALEHIKSQPSMNKHLSQPGFTTNMSFQGLNPTLHDRSYRGRQSQDHGCTPEKLPNNQKQRIVPSQKPEKVYNNRGVCLNGGPGSAPSDNLDIVATTNRNIDRRGNHARGSDTLPAFPNYMSRPAVPAHGRAALPQPHTILTRTNARGLHGAAPQVPLQSHGSRVALGSSGTSSGRLIHGAAPQVPLQSHDSCGALGPSGTSSGRRILGAAPQVPLHSHGSCDALGPSGTSSGRHFRQQGGSKQTKEVVGSTFRFSALEHPNSQPAMNRHLSQPRFTTNMSFQGQNPTLPDRSYRGRQSQDYLTPGSSQGLNEPSTHPTKKGT